MSLIVFAACEPDTSTLALFSLAEKDLFMTTKVFAQVTRSYKDS
jgi:hypothetical protein